MHVQHTDVVRVSLAIQASTETPVNCPSTLHLFLIWGILHNFWEPCIFCEEEDGHQAVSEDEAKGIINRITYLSEFCRSFIRFRWESRQVYSSLGQDILTRATYPYS